MADAQDLKDRVTQQMNAVETKAKAIAEDLKQKQQYSYSKITHATWPMRDWYLQQCYKAPLLSTFLTIQFCLAFVPVAIFLGFALGTILTVLTCATLLIGSVLFFAGCVLFSVLFFTSITGVIVFTNIALAFLFGKWALTVRASGLQDGSKQFVRDLQKLESENEKSQTQVKVEHSTGASAAA